MADLFYESPDVTLFHGDAFSVVRGLENESVDCVLTSPPYWRQRDYSGHPDQWGQEKSVGSYVDKLVYLFSAIMPKLKPRGVVWLNLGDKRVDGQLCGLPWMVAKDMQSDGWLLRSAVVWDKPNGMPESVSYTHLTLPTNREV